MSSSGTVVSSVGAASLSGAPSVSGVAGSVGSTVIVGVGVSVGVGGSGVGVSVEYSAMAPVSTGVSSCSPVWSPYWKNTGNREPGSASTFRMVIVGPSVPTARVSCPLMRTVSLTLLPSLVYWMVMVTGSSPSLTRFVTRLAAPLPWVIRRVLRMAIVPTLPLTPSLAS
ncbi:hypothetical protein EEJ31_05650 [Cryobacterium tepidiphilum]|uniref:Uncharacterized protein n=1 Tax=Cryobacterium tepidiphilum TaxID=2486026 RepID=A0A3M8LHT3_9MICO|nr:hypothetical protein EEJ31_05650 [Cryobacterium tepidiphilum]